MTLYVLVIDQKQLGLLAQAHKPSYFEPKAGIWQAQGQPGQF